MNPAVATAQAAQAPPAGAIVRGPALAHAYASCADVVRRRARNFYYGLRLTPEPRRSAVYSIYAWMRWGDDAVDNAGAPDKRRAALEHFATTTRRVLAGDRAAGTEPFWPAFAATMADYPIRREWIDDMLSGLGEDLEPRRLTNMPELERYCYRVASTVGLVCMAIWGLRDDATATDMQSAHDLSIRRGHAFQLTNILRDFAQDFDDQPPRVYLPAEVLARHGVNADALRAWRDPARCVAAVGELAGIAMEHYIASEPLEELVSADCRPTLWAMTRIYRGILERIERHPACIVGPRRVRLSGAAKTTIALRAWLRTKIGGGR